MIIPASIRNNNPGAQYPGPSAKRFGAIGFETLRSKDGEHKIATFPSAVQGAAAMFDLLYRKYTGITIEKAITRWCGAFYVSTYLKVLEEKAGVKRSDTLTKDLLRDPEKAIALAKAMAWQEAGKEYPMTDAEWRQAHLCAFQQSVAPAFAVDNDVPSPKPETRQAEAVRKASPIAAVTAAVTGGATHVATNGIPSPPAQITDSVANMSAWQGLISTVIGSSVLVASIVGVVTLAGIVAISKWRST